MPAKNVIFVMVDTLRADHTTLSGYHRSTTPFMESLAAEGVVFEYARSQAGCTYPSVNSMLTSRYPFDFYRRGPGTMGIPEEYSSIAEILKDHGYSTAAVSASPIVRNTPNEHNPSAGFGRGFDVFDESCLWQAAECVNKRAEEIIQTIEEPFFLYLHYMDPHDPYQPPAGRRRFSGPYDGFDFIAAGNPNPIGEMLYDDGPVIDFDDADIQHLVDLYDDEIFYFDDMLGELVGFLRGIGVLDDSMFILTADHGEEFLEHGQVKHCRGVWNTLTHVPMLIRAPGIEGGVRIDTAVQALDLVPTILDYLGLDGSSADLTGRSLLPLLSGTIVGEHYAFSDQVKYRSVDDGRFHYILDGLEDTISLFDIRIDELEQIDLYSDDHPVVESLGFELDAWLDVTGQLAYFDAALAAAKAQQDQLKALGYIE
jgi:arylsulfatase A-like enzyme